MSSFNMLGATLVATGENYSKLEKIIEIKKFRKTLISSGFTELFGGDKRDRTADLLNAIQRKVVVAVRFFGYLVATW